MYFVLALKSLDICNVHKRNCMHFDWSLKCMIVYSIFSCYVYYISYMYFLIWLELPLFFCILTVDVYENINIRPLYLVHYTHPTLSSVI